MGHEFSGMRVRPGTRILSSLVLSGGFFLTGAATVLLGVALPVLSERWGLRDASAGFLLFLQFLGSTTGAIFTGSNFARSLCIGYGLLTISSCALAFSGASLSFVFIFFFGMGLGMAITATSLVFSERYREKRAASLGALNFAWAAGATSAPLLFVPFLRRSNVGQLYLAFDAFFLLLLLWMLLQERRRVCNSLSPSVLSEPQTSAPLRSLLPLLTLSMCAVGAETALSGWLTTYSHRADPLDLGGAALATSLFWFGIMLSRLACSTSLLSIVGRRRMLGLTLWSAGGAVALLICAHHVPLIRVAATLAGLAFGPLYPLVLSFLLERSTRGWIFAVGGVGSAIFPEFTGLLSTQFGSLRYGLIVPWCAVLLMICLHQVILRPVVSGVGRAGLFAGRGGGAADSLLGLPADCDR